jgi:hypothetical protein
MESFIKDGIIMNKEINFLNIFESIQELQKMIPTRCNKLFIEIDTAKLMSLSRYKRLNAKNGEYLLSILHIL